MDRACEIPTHRTLRDGLFGVALSQALRAKFCLSSRDSGTDNDFDRQGPSIKLAPMGVPPYFLGRGVAGLEQSLG
jgi:hypothetical protein